MSIESRLKDLDLDMLKELYIDIQVKETTGKFTELMVEINKDRKYPISKKYVKDLIIKEFGKRYIKSKGV